MIVRPRLVIDAETNRLCIQVCLGSDAATLPLPASLKDADEAEIEAYMKKVVPEMVEGLRKRWREEQRRIKRDLDA